MTRIIKVDDMVAINLPKVAPMLTTFYQEEKVIAILKQAESVADQLLKERSRIESDYIIQMEADRAQALIEISAIKEQARLEGLKAGKEAAYQAFSDVFDLIETVKSAFVTQRKLWAEAAEADIVKLTLVIAEKLVQQELATHPDLIVGFIRAILKETSENQRLTIQVNPDDLELINKHLPELKQTLGSVKTFEAESNSSIPRGGVILDMDSGMLDARIETQMAKLYQSLVNEPA